MSTVIHHIYITLSFTVISLVDETARKPGCTVLVLNCYKTVIIVQRVCRDAIHHTM